MSTNLANVCNPDEVEDQLPQAQVKIPWQYCPLCYMPWDSHGTPKCNCPRLQTYAQEYFIIRGHYPKGWNPDLPIEG